MGLLGQLSIFEGKEDHFASIHQLLSLCCHPFSNPVWGLSCFTDDAFPYQMSHLIDADLRCPTADCLALSSSGNERNIREGFRFEQLIQACDNFGYRRSEAYTYLREFIGRNPITTREDIEDYLQKHNIMPAQRFLINECYILAQSAWFVEGGIYICSSCRAPIHRFSDNLANCVISQCSMYHKHVEMSDSRNDSNLMVLKPELLSDWFGPAIDEIAVYDLAKQLDLNVTLYPDFDACDIAIDENDIGIDIKSYSSPYLLANKLSRDVGRLVNYDRKIVAISDSALNRFPGYLKTLEREYDGETKLEFMGVSELLELIRKVA